MQREIAMLMQHMQTLETSSSAHRTAQATMRASNGRDRTGSQRRKIVGEEAYPSRRAARPTPKP